MKPLILSHEFVEAIPDKLEDHTIYISVGYATVVHKCCCGCGREVVTPLSPTDWKVIFDGASISLSPSIGNWSFDCQSHYWIVGNQVRWAEAWSSQQIEAGRLRSHQAKKTYNGSASHLPQSPEVRSQLGFFHRLSRRIFSLISGSPH
ncbi:MAG: DUF6527 family protein [Kiloniellaceae bacterium]